MACAGIDSGSISRMSFPSGGAPNPPAYRGLAADGRLAERKVKQSVQETEFMPEKEALAIELQHGTPVFASKDAREGPKAFKEKRTPQFKGR